MKRNIIAVLLLLMPFMAGAQALKGSYFMDNSLNRHEMNPAFAPRSNYFQLLGIGNMGMGVYSNLDVPTFLYPSANGELLTFLNNNVSSKQFGRSLARHPHIDAEMEATLLSFGFYTSKSAFWSFDFGMKAMVDTDLPRDLFMFIKKGTGTSGSSYNIGNINAYSSAALQASIGHSREIIPGLRAGVKANFIAPVAYASLNLENVRLTTGQDKWNLTTEGYLNVAVQGLETNQPEGELVPEMNFNLQNTLANKVLAGFGVSLDLGAEYVMNFGNLLDGLTVSAAITDLGFIKYSPKAMNSYKTAGSVDWVGFQNVSMDNTDFEASINDFVENAQEQLINLSQDKDSKLTRSAMPRYYLGAEMPFLKNLMSVGLLYSGRSGQHYARHELTAAYTLTPAKCISLGVNYSFLNTARTLGWLIEFAPRIGPTFYIGGDYLPMSLAQVPMLENSMEFPAALGKVLGTDTWAIPMSYRFNLNFGIGFALGSKHTVPEKKMAKRAEKQAKKDAKKNN